MKKIIYPLLLLLVCTSTIQAQSILLTKLAASTIEKSQKSELIIYKDGSYTQTSSVENAITDTKNGQFSEADLKSLKKLIKKASIIRLQNKYKCKSDETAASNVMYSFYTSSVAKKIFFKKPCSIPSGLEAVDHFIDDNMTGK